MCLSRVCWLSESAATLGCPNRTSLRLRHPERAKSQSSYMDSCEADDPRLQFLLRVGSVASSNVSRSLVTIRMRPINFQRLYQSSCSSRPLVLRLFLFRSSVLAQVSILPIHPSCALAFPQENTMSRITYHQNRNQNHYHIHNAMHIDWDRSFRDLRSYTHQRSSANLDDRA